MGNQYPKWLYGRDGSPRIVKNHDEHLLYPDMKESPADFTAAPVLAELATLPAGLRVAADIVAAADVMMKRFYTVPVKVIAEQVMRLSSLDEVREVRDMEEQRPGGPRKGVLQAVLARMEQLTPPLVDE